MDTKGQAHSTWGFQTPEPGWYLMEFSGEFPDPKPNEETGKITLRIPLKIVEGDYSGSQQSVFITLNPEKDGELRANKKKVANILAATGLEEMFDKKFPGEISALDPKIIDAMKLKIPGKSIMVRLDETKSKDGKVYLNIMEMAPSGFVPDKPNGNPKGKAAGNPGGLNPKPAQTQTESSDSDW